MGIEQDINQSKFKNEYQKASVNLIYTFNWMTEKLRIFFEKHGLTSQQFNILRILRGAGQPLSTLQIRQRMLDKMSDTSRIVDRISISDKGRKLLMKMDEHQNKMDAVLGNLSISEARTLNKLFDKIRQPK
jgi:DNA-binding MarR family transcriptional regulator